MVSINYSAREVCCKIVYYGPGLSGKTTNLQFVHSKVPGNSRGDLISLATEADRTLYFDFLPINIGTVNGFQAKFQLYTVPGQVYYNATRKLVLRGVDGIVFVADSQPDKMDENVESLVNLEENLREFGYDINNIPMVIQYNKRDLPNVMPVEELQQQLNTRSLPHFEASATVGNGVFGTLKLIIKMVLDKAKASATTATQRPSVSSAPAAPTKQVPQAEPPQPPPTQQAPPVPTPEVKRVPVTPSSAPVSSEPPVQPQTAPTPEPASASDTAPIEVAQAEPATVTAAPSPPVAPTEPSTPAPTQRSQPGAAAVAVESPPSGSPHPEARPYPGSTGSNTSEHRLSTTSFAPSRQDELETSSLSRNVAAEEQGPDNTLHRVGMAPRMAPSLKQHDKRKKRGFFKRLFGIK